MELFFVEESNKNLEVGTSIVFSESESNHLKNVFRKEIGHKVSATNGQGLHLKVVIEEYNKKQIKGTVVEKEEHTLPNYSSHIAIAPTKNISRFEWFLEKSVEIGGISEITPIITKHSERKIIKIERCEKIIQSALKQSHQFILPKFNPVISFDEFVKKNQKGYIAHCYQEEKSPLFSAITKGEKNIVLIGPEGDFSKDEVALAIENNYTPVNLGNQRLRTETAGVVACHMISLKNSHFAL